MDVSKILIFCADNETGYRLCQLSTHAGYGVVAVLRHGSDPDRFENLGVECVFADPTQRDEVEAVLAELDSQGLGVVCMLGGSSQLNSQGNINVIDASTAAGIRRFLMITSIGCGDSADAVDPFVKAFIGKALRAKNWAETHLRASDMDWTIIRAGGMMRRPFRGHAMLVESPNVSGYINQTDLGDAVFHALASSKTMGRVLTAVNRDKAFDIKGEPLVAAEL